MCLRLLGADLGDAHCLRVTHCACCRYNHTADPGENFNLNSTKRGDPAVSLLSARLSAMLRAGPRW